MSIQDVTGGRQTIQGFGAAWTDATVEVFDSLDTSLQETLLMELFAPMSPDDIGDRIALRLSRHTVGMSDLTPSSIDAWSFDETDGDVSLADFSLGVPGAKMADWLRRMKTAANPATVTTVGSIWSPPTWMKQDNNLRWEYRDTYANYIVQYVKALGAAPYYLSLDALCLQNEPLHSGAEEWTMYMDSSYAAILTNITRAALDTAGLSATALWAYDHNTDVPDYPQYVLDQSSPGSVEAVAWHCYASGGADWNVLSTFQAVNPSVDQYMTECWLHLDSGEAFFDLPGFTIGPLQNYARGVIAWVLGGSTAYDVAFPGGCDPCSGIIQVDMTSGTYTKTQDYYTLGQFSRFVEIGATVLSTTGNYDWPDGTGVQTTAFRNPSDGGVVVVVLNKMYSNLQLNIHLESGGGWSANVKSRSVTTFVLDSK